MQKVILLGTALFLFIGMQCFADQNIVTETYDLTAPKTCESLELNGVTYSFTVGGAPSLDCMAGIFGGPGKTNSLNPPLIEGTSAGVLHLTFDVPTTAFGFGVALSIVANAPKSVIVNLYRPGAGLLREEVVLSETPDPFFAGGSYYYEGPAVKSVTIQFPITAGRFALDNVKYFRPPGQQKK